jgi:hypothetical protein
MHFLRVALVIVTGLGVTWAAQQLTGDAGLRRPADLVLKQSADKNVPGSGAPAEQSEGVRTAAAEPTELEDLSQQELDAELKRVEQALGEDEELKEFTPSKPLAADIPIEYPSDI